MTYLFLQQSVELYFKVISAHEKNNFLYVKPHYNVVIARMSTGISNDIAISLMSLCDQCSANRIYFQRFLEIAVS